MTTEEEDLMPKKTAPPPPTPIKGRKKAATKKAGAPAGPTRTTMDPSVMNDILLAIHEKAEEINEARAILDGLIGESDQLVKEAVDEGERYRDIAGAANRTVPWVQMSLRRVAGVATHPAAPIPDSRVKRARRAS